MFKRAGAIVLCLFVVFGLVNCQKRETAQQPATGTSAGTSGFAGRTLDILFMVGGQGQMADPVIEKLKSLYPGLTINVVYDHNAADILRNRILAGDPPDIFDVNATFFDKYSAISDGIMKPIDFLYDVPCVDDPSGTLKDIMNFSVMNFGYVDGKYYCVPDSVYTSGLWYDARMFRDKGYKIPETWDEFVALGDKAKAGGKYLLAYSTRYGGEYFGNYWFYPLLCSIDINAFGKIQKLEPNAYSDPAVVKTMTLTKELLDKGYIDAVSGTLDITETQMGFCNGNVLFYACGSWLEAEMAGNWPDGFELTYLPFPPQKAGEPSYTPVMGVESSISATTKNEDIVKEYYRYLLSDREVTTKVIEITQNGLGVADFAQNYGNLLPSSVSSSWAPLDSGRCIGISPLADSFYAGIGEATTDNSSAFNAGKMSVQQYIDAMNKTCDGIRADSSIIKRPYDMSALMEAVTQYKVQ
jgi:N-acetylglucosamine transport system substrate-binding protein